MLKKTGWLLTSIALFGAFTLFSQVLLLREFLVVFYGNEICLGLVFCCWLFWIAVGAWVARRLARHLHRERSHGIWIASLCLLPLSLPVQVFLIRVLRGILNVPTGEWIPFFTMVAAILVILAPLGFLIGFSFPAACRILPKEGTGAVSIGRVYIYEALGSLMGGLAFTFFLVDRLHPFGICGLGGAVLTLSTLPLTIRLPPPQRRVFMPPVLLVLISQLLLLSFGQRLQTYSIQKRWESFGHREVLKASVDSRYQNISLGYAKGQYSLYGNGLWAYSFPDEYSFANLAHLALSEHPDPSSVLLVGGGEGGLIREILKHPIQHLTYVELDPSLIRTVKGFLPEKDRQALEDTRVSLQFQDGRYFIKHSGAHFDAVLINLPDPDTAMLNRYYTLDFFEEVKKILDPGGMVFLGLTSTANFAGEDVISYGRSVYRTLKSVFPYLVVTPGPPQYFFAASSPGVVSSDPTVLSRRFLDRRIQSETFSAYLFEQIFPQERVRTLRSVLESKGPERLNTDLHPVTYFYNLILWSRASSASLAGLFGFLQRIPYYGFFIPLLLLLSVSIFLRKRFPPSSGALFTIATTGFFGLGLEIVILFLFQNFYGYVYQKIGLIVALFMFGLALGGAMANRLLKEPDNQALSYLKWSDAAICLLALITPWIPVISTFAGWPVDGMLYGTMILIGISAGFQFPLVGAVCLSDGMGQARAAATLDSRDHLGACVGALLTGVFLVPLLGIGGTCTLIAGIKGVSLLGLFTKRDS